MKPGNYLSKPWGRAFLALVLVVAIGCAANADGAFFHWSTHRDMLRQVSVYGILACGMTLVVITGGIDLAVGSVLGLCAVLFAQLSIQRGLPAFAAIGAVVLAGAAAGLTSGTLVARFKMQAFIATLAVMVFARGLAKWISGGQKISGAIQRPDGSFDYVELPAIFRQLDARLLGGNIAAVTLVFAACLAVSWVVLAKLRYGRYLYATGGNDEAARLSGVPTVRAKLLAYGLSGAFAAIAGICQAAQEQQGDRGDRWQQPGGRTRRDRPDAARRAHDRLSGKNPQHQRGRRIQPADAHGRHHRRRGAAAAEEGKLRLQDSIQKLTANLR